MTTQIQHEAMLVDLSMGSWTATAFDKEATDELLDQKHANGKAARVRKTLVAPDRIKAIRKSSRRIRELHDLLTVPWNNRGERLLPVKNYDTYRNMVDAEMETRHSEVLAFCNGYQDAIKEARHTLGDLFNEDDYDSVEEVRGSYFVEYSFSAIPDASHFIADIHEDEARRIRERVEKQTTARLQAGVSSLYGRIAEVLETMIGQIDPANDGDKAPRIYDSVLKRMRDVIDTIPNLNLTGDPDLTRICQELGQRLDGIDMAQFRPKAKEYDPKLRQSVTSDLQGISQRLAGYMQAPAA